MSAALDLESHVRACERCVIVGCTPRSLCRRGRALWNRWVKSGKGAVCA